MPDPNHPNDPSIPVLTDVLVSGDAARVRSTRPQEPEAAPPTAGSVAQRTEPAPAAGSVAQRAEPAPAAGSVTQQVEPPPAAGSVAQQAEPAPAAGSIAQQVEPAPAAGAVAQQAEPAPAAGAVAQQAEPAPAAGAVAQQAEPPPTYDADLIAERLRGRFANYLTGDGRGIIEARCRDALQEHTSWLVSQITREVALALETEVAEWVREAVKEEIARRSAGG